MKCEESLSLISPYLDRELDPLRSQEVEKHLHDCDGCAAVSKELQNLRAAVSGAPVSVAPPTDLERRLRETLRREAGPLIVALRSSNWPRLTTPMGLALALAALLLLLTLINGGRADHAARPDALLADLVAGQVRSLMVDHLVDVASSNPQTVKPWFNGKVDFAPPVADFTAEGYQLVGGRMDYIAGRPVAALVYKHRHHLVNVFLWPAGQREEVDTIRSYSTQGYELLNWSVSGLTYWAVSDLSPTDLQVLAGLIKSAA